MPVSFLFIPQHVLTGHQGLPWHWGLNTGQRKEVSAPMEEVSQGARQVSGPQSEAEYREEGARLQVSRGQVCLPSLGVGRGLPQKETGELGSERYIGIN